MENLTLSQIKITIQALEKVRNEVIAEMQDTEVNNEDLITYHNNVIDKYNDIINTFYDELGL